MQEIIGKVDTDGDRQLSKMEVMAWLNQNRSSDEILTTDRFELEFGDIDDEGDNFFQVDEIQEIAEQISEYNPRRRSEEITRLASDVSDTQMYVVLFFASALVGLMLLLDSEVNAASQQVQSLQTSIMNSGESLKQKQQEVENLRKREAELERQNLKGSAFKQAELKRVSEELKQKAKEKVLPSINQSFLPNPSFLTFLPNTPSILTLPSQPFLPNPSILHIPS
jgi:hypothetical protein